MRKAWIVARHEFAVVVKRVWFVIAAFVLPLFLAGTATVMHFVAEGALEDSRRALEEKPLGVVDLSGELAVPPPEGLKVRRFPDEESARSALASKDIVVCLVLPARYAETGQVRVLTSRRAAPLTGARGSVPEKTEDWFLENALRHVDPARRDLVKAPFRPSTEFLGPDGRSTGEDAKETQQKSAAAYGFFILLFMSIFSSSQYLLQGLAEEKENRVMEMVLSSVTADQLMLGKLIGLGAAGLLQLGIWTGMALAATLFLPAIVVALSPATFVVCFLLFLFGYALFASLMLGFGALGTNLRESQQIASVWSFIGVTPFFILIALFENPQGTLARVFSYIPFTAPTTMMFRYVADPKGTPAWEIPLVMAVLAVSTWLALKAGARLFRAGLLLYGKRPTPREIWRWVVVGPK